MPDHPQILFRQTWTGRGFREALPLLVFGLAVLAGPVIAAEWFVSPDGDDQSGNGSIEAPFRTVQHLLAPGNDIAQAGDTITLRGPPGNNTYRECDVRLRRRLVLQSYPGERAHVHCDPRTPDSVVIQIDPDGSGSRLRNLEISGGSHYGVMLQTGWYVGGGENGSGATDVVLEDLLIHDTGRDGIKVTPKSDNLTVRRSEIRNTGAIYPPGTPMEEMNADGIDNVNGSGMLVEDSHLHDIATTGLYFKGGAADVVIQRNRIENVGMSGILVGFDTSPEWFDTSINPGYYESIRAMVRNNVVRNAPYAGIGLYAAKDAVVANNTIVNAGRRGHAGLYFGISFQDGYEKAGRPASVNPRLINNLVSVGSGNCIEIRHSWKLGGLSGLVGAPGSNWNGFERSGCHFVDARPGHGTGIGRTLEQWRRVNGADGASIEAAFLLDDQGRPGPGSPALDAGSAIDEVVDDIDGNRRHGKLDLGAYEVGDAPAAAVIPVAVVVAGSDGSRIVPADLPMLSAKDAGRSSLASVVMVLAWLAGLGLLAMLVCVVRLIRSRNITGWLTAYLRQDWRAGVPEGTTRHLLFCFVDHFEPAWGAPGIVRERERVARWSREFPLLCASHRDADGRPPVHSFFYPGEEYRPEHVEALVVLCRQGLGEIEVHLHHDDDTEAGLREKLSRFTRKLAVCHDALPRDPFSGQPRWAFIHGDWALDNSHPTGRHCGVDNELIVLREEGCYADFTFPAAPDPCQPRTINRIYYAHDDPTRPKSHDTGPLVRAGGTEEGDLMIIQGPLGLRWNSRKLGVFPRIENADVRASCPPTRERIDGWVDTGIHVAGRPEWVVVKVHTHGAEDHDIDTLLGSAMDEAFTYLETRYNDGRDWKLHYVSARETYNIIKAAEQGNNGDPGQYRNYLIPRPAYARANGGAACPPDSCPPDTADSTGPADVSPRCSVSAG